MRLLVLFEKRGRFLSALLARLRELQQMIEKGARPHWYALAPLICALPGRVEREWSPLDQFRLLECRLVRLVARYGKLIFVQSGGLLSGQFPDLPAGR